MLRPRAVRELLVEAAGVRVAAPAGGGGEPAGEAGAGGPDETGGGAPARAAEAARRREQEALDRAHRRALVVAALDAVAIAVLLLLRQDDRFLVLARNEETVFTLGVLAVAVHLGFRLAHALTVGTVRRLHAELSEREE